MLLNLSLVLLLCVSVAINNIKILLMIFFTLVVLNLFNVKNLKKKLPSLKILIFFYAMTFFVQLFYNQEGKVLFKIYGIYITENGVINFLTNFLRIFNLILISWLFKFQNKMTGKLGKYQKIIQIVIELVPEVFTLFKKRLSPKTFFRHILRQIRLKYESDLT